MALSASVHTVEVFDALQYGFEVFKTRLKPWGVLWFLSFYCEVCKDIQQVGWFGMTFDDLNSGSNAFFFLQPSSTCFLFPGSLYLIPTHPNHFSKVVPLNNSHLRSLTNGPEIVGSHLVLKRFSAARSRSGWEWVSEPLGNISFSDFFPVFQYRPSNKTSRQWTGISTVDSSLPRLVATYLVDHLHWLGQHGYGKTLLVNEH